MAINRTLAIEKLAIVLHNSGREAVEKRQIYRDDVPVKPFCEWEELPENAREGRRSMARYLVNHGEDVIMLITKAGGARGRK